MEESTAVIRQQMDETRSQLSEKLQSLENQVSETVQSTGTAVSATAGAVQDTVESITGAVQDAVKSVSSAFDLQQHMEKHPWMVLGGAVVLGYLVCEAIEGPGQRDEEPSRSGRSASPGGATQNDATRRERASAYSAAPESRRSNSAWDQITGAATVSVIGILQEAAARVVPELMDYLGFNEPRDSRHSTANSDNGAGRV